jgi:hypothetical protein
MFNRVGVAAFKPRESADAGKIEDLILLATDKGAEDFFPRDIDGGKEWVVCPLFV